MDKWPAKHAKAQFSAMPDACIAEGPQLISRRGVETAVLLRVAEWRRLQTGTQPSLKQLLLAEGARFSPLSSPRGKASRRTPVAAR